MLKDAELKLVAQAIIYLYEQGDLEDFVEAYEEDEGELMGATVEKLLDDNQYVIESLAGDLETIVTKALIKKLQAIHK